MRAIHIYEWRRLFGYSGRGGGFNSIGCQIYNPISDETWIRKVFGINQAELNHFYDQGYMWRNDSTREWAGFVPIEVTQ